MYIFLSTFKMRLAKHLNNNDPFYFVNIASCVYYIKICPINFLMNTKLFEKHSCIYVWISTFISKHILGNICRIYKFNKWYEV